MRPAAILAGLLLAASAAAAPVPSDVALGSDGTDYLVCWTVFPGAVWCVRVTSQGAIVGSPAQISLATPTDGASALTIAHGSGRYILAYQSSSGTNFGLGVSILAGDATGVATASVASAHAYASHRPPAFDGTNFMIVWHDDRNYTSQNPSDIYAARIGVDGTTLDPGGFPVTSADGPDIDPTVVFAGGDHLVLWSRRGTSDLDIYGARVSPGAVVRDPGGFLVSAGAGDEVGTTAVWDGSSSFVITMSTTSGVPHRFVRVSGTQVTAMGTLVTPDPEDSNDQLAFANGTYLLAWNGSPSHVARIDSNGQLLDPNGIPVPVQGLVAVATNGNGFLVGWIVIHTSTCLGQVSGDLKVARISSSGTLLDPQGIAIITGDPVSEAPCPLPEFDCLDACPGGSGGASGGGANGGGAMNASGCGCDVGSVTPAVGALVVALCVAAFGVGLYRRRLRRR